MEDPTAQPSYVQDSPDRGSGSNNPNWRGGRHISTEGYVKILLGEGHCDADSRGYAYEHRIVAERKIGRKLREGEEIHHVNGDKTDNQPENIEVVTHWQHRMRHRHSNSNRRTPDDNNISIACACGCGVMFDRFDTNGRPRKYIQGHNHAPRAVHDEQTMCECGCGRTFPLYDKYGRKRMYVSGHNTRRQDGTW